MAFAHDTRDRVKGGASAVLVQLAVGYALISGLHVSFASGADNPLKLFDVAPPPAPPPPPPAPVKTDAAPRTEGRAAPPNLRARPKEIVAPPPIVTIPPPIPMLAPPVASTGNAARAGASDRIGPGTGAGGIGDGLGSGGRGDGDGGGGRGRGEAPPRQIGGRISNADYPPEADLMSHEGRVSTRYRIEADGRVSSCRIDESSGSSVLDRHTCDLVMRRFRFRPARDEDGRPVASTMIQDHYWDIQDLPPSPTERRRRDRDRW